MIERYLRYLRSVRNASPHTLRAYEQDIRRYLSYLAARGLAEQEADQAAVRGFVASLRKAGMADRSVNRIISGVRGYYRFQQRLSAAGETVNNPLEGFRGPKVAERLPGFLFEEELEQIVDSRRPGTRSEGLREEFLALRDRTMFEVLYSTGCRVSELVALNVSDLDLKGRRAVVMGKGGKERTVFLGTTAHGLLIRYLVRRIERVRDGEPDSAAALFINSRGRRLTDRGVRYVLRRHVAGTEVRKQVSPHTFRHTMATHVLDAGADIRVVQELLGHASLSTTQIYTHVGLSRLREVYARAHPHARK